MPTIEQLVAFCILMEQGRGIVSKHPAYVFEKYEAATSMARPEVLLDPDNLAKFQTYMTTWKAAWAGKEA